MRLSLSSHLSPSFSLCMRGMCVCVCVLRLCLSPSPSRRARPPCEPAAFARRREFPARHAPLARRYLQTASYNLSRRARFVYSPALSSRDVSGVRYLIIVSRVINRSTAIADMRQRACETKIRKHVATFSVLLSSCIRVGCSSTVACVRAERINIVRMILLRRV